MGFKDFTESDRKDLQQLLIEERPSESDVESPIYQHPKGFTVLNLLAQQPIIEHPFGIQRAIEALVAICVEEDRIGDVRKVEIALRLADVLRKA